MNTDISAMYWEKKGLLRIALASIGTQELKSGLLHLGPTSHPGRVGHTVGILLRKKPNLYESLIITYN